MTTAREEMASFAKQQSDACAVQAAHNLAQNRLSQTDRSFWAEKSTDHAEPGQINSMNLSK